MAVEVANYNMRHISASMWREQELFIWWFVHRMYHYTSGSPTVMNSTLSSSQTEMLLTFRPSLTKTELPCLLCGRSATSVIPGMLGLARSLALCVSWRHRQWQCLFLHNSDGMAILLAVRPSMFADIIISVSEEL